MTIHDKVDNSEKRKIPEKTSAKSEIDSQQFRSPNNPTNPVFQKRDDLYRLDIRTQNTFNSIHGTLNMAKKQ